MSEEKVSTFKEVTVSISMSKSVYLEVPDGTTDEQFLERAKKEILTPDKVMAILASILEQSGIRVDTREIVDWNIDELEYIVEDGGNSTAPEGEQSDAQVYM